VKNALSPFGVENRMALRCSDIWLSPQMSMAFNLIVHELATNAAKYGGLSVPEGRVQIDCQHSEDQPGMAVFKWSELGGAPVKPPQRLGFGTKLIERCAKHELGGEASIAYRPEGFECVIRFPAEDHASASGLTGGFQSEGKTC
jgi:two-component sensor histidine kinase